jgi:hypothetical protein
MSDNLKSSPTTIRTIPIFLLLWQSRKITPIISG